MLAMNDNVVVKVIEHERKMTEGGIHIPDTAYRKPMRGSVVAVGPGRKTSDGTRAPVEVGVGEEVVFDEQVGYRIKIEGEEYLVLAGHQCLAISEPV
jgi:chaperonin GroES